MAGTRLGGKRTAATNKAKYGDDYYVRLGSAGGSTRHRETRPFYLDRDLAKRAGTNGGKVSRRPKMSQRKKTLKKELNLLQRLFSFRKAA